MAIQHFDLIPAVAIIFASDAVPGIPPVVHFHFRLSAFDGIGRLPHLPGFGDEGQLCEIFEQPDVVGAHEHGVVPSRGADDGPLRPSLLSPSGDAGSLFLGYVLAYLAIKYQMYNDGSVFIYREESLLISITLLFIPCIDVIRVALSRKIQGKRMFDADKTHIHHVLMQRGLSMRMTLAVIISLFVFISATNYLLYDFIPSTLIIIIDIIIYALFIYISKRQTK